MGFQNYINENITPEMEDWFKKRTKKHINLVKKYAKKIQKAFPEYKGLVKQAANHDASKLTEPELTPYIHISWMYKNKQDGKDYKIPKSVDDNKATVHHVRTNSHHPEYHSDSTIEINRKDRDSNNVKMVDATAMPPIDIAEMVADWMAMSEELGTNPRDWAKKVINRRYRFLINQTNIIHQIIDNVWDNKVNEASEEDWEEFLKDKPWEEDKRNSSNIRVNILKSNGFKSQGYLIFKKENKKEWTLIQTDGNMTSKYIQSDDNDKLKDFLLAVMSYFHIDKMDAHKWGNTHIRGFFDELNKMRRPSLKEASEEDYEDFKESHPWIELTRTIKLNMLKSNGFNKDGCVYFKRQPNNEMSLWETDDRMLAKYVRTEDKERFISLILVMMGVLKIKKIKIDIVNHSGSEWDEEIKNFLEEVNKKKHPSLYEEVYRRITTMFSGKEVPIFKNPQSQFETKEPHMRGILTPKGDLYVWNADVDFLHMDAEDRFKELVHKDNIYLGVDFDDNTIIVSDSHHSKPEFENLKKKIKNNKRIQTYMENNKYTVVMHYL